MLAGINVPVEAWVCRREKVFGVVPSTSCSGLAPSSPPSCSRGYLAAAEGQQLDTSPQYIAYVQIRQQHKHGVGSIYDISATTKSHWKEREPIDRAQSLSWLLATLAKRLSLECADWIHRVSNTRLSAWLWSSPLPLPTLPAGMCLDEDKQHWQLWRAQLAKEGCWSMKSLVILQILKMA